MTLGKADPLLAVARILLLIGQGIMALAALALIVGLAVLPFLAPEITAELRTEYADPALVFPLWPVLGVMACALVIVALVFFFLQKMRRIVDTVADGDPFVPQNADRLTLMAWLMLAIQLMVVPLAGLILLVQKMFEEVDATIDASVDLSGIIMVITLFILARVFRKGTEMREELEGTV